MTKLIASLFALAVIVAAVPAAADCAGHEQTTAQSAPVVTSDATDTAPMTPVPPPESTTTTPPTTTTAPKTGG
jgi:hypothetical protein